MVPEFNEMTEKQLLNKISQLEEQINDSPDNTASPSIKKIMHELQVHQIELEMQNRELQEAQLQLELTRDEYADLYDFAPVNYVTFDKEGVITNINLAGATMLGEVRTQIIGHSFTRWLDKNDKNEFINYIQSTLDSNLKKTLELKIKTAGNNVLEVRIESVRSKEISSNNYLCRSVILDITEYNQRTNKIYLQARQLRLITDALPVLISYIDINETHLFANKTYKDIFGLYFEDILGKTASEIWGQDNYNKVKQHLATAFSGKSVNFDIELPIGETGSKFFHTTLIPDYDTENHVYGIIVLIGDITDRLVIEAIDRKRLLDISHFSRLSTMGEMASEIAHELNQPLAAISIYSDACSRLILSNKGEENKIIQTLKEISTQAERAGDFIRRIREFASKKEVQRITTDINKLVKDALQLLSVEVRSHNVKLTFDLEEDIPEVLVDKILIEQVIFNLARNALEAMDEVDKEERFLRITTSVNTNHDIEVTINDTGPGIPKSIINKIFNSFYTTKQDGMGMGLAICHSVIEAHSGHLQATSNKNGGTTFTFSLPVPD